MMIERPDEMTGNSALAIKLEESGLTYEARKVDEPARIPDEG
jgi:hypothetical protein